MTLKADDEEDNDDGEDTNEEEQESLSWDIIDFGIKTTHRQQKHSGMVYLRIC